MSNQRRRRHKHTKKQVAAQDIQDERFSKAHTDPRFRSLPKRKKKVQLDQRFAGLFDDPAFRPRGKIDKYGRKVSSPKKNEDMGQFYELDTKRQPTASADGVKLGGKNRLHSEAGEDKKERQSSPSRLSQRKSDLKRKRADSPPYSCEDGHIQLAQADEEVSADPGNETIGFQDDDEKAERFARMRGLLEDSSDEESDSADDPLTDIEEDVDVDLSSWGIGAFAANPEEEIEECAPSSRLAVVDLDWDNICAVDILHIMRSFLPAPGFIKKVSVYVSEYGLGRMAEEDAKGPGALGVFENAEKRRERRSLCSVKPSNECTEGDGIASRDVDVIRGHGGDASDDINVENLRTYEKSRLRYHYAVVECDSSESAAHLVAELDGKEFEMSHCIFDLRYIPDETAFDDCHCRETATNIPDAYDPPKFECDAMTKTNLKLSWDGDDPHRQKQIRRKFCEEDLIKDDFQVYMASDSDKDSVNEDTQNIESIREHYLSKFGKLEDSSQSDTASDSGDSRVPLAPVGDTNLTDSDFVELSDQDSLSRPENEPGTQTDRRPIDSSSDVEDELSVDGTSEVNKGLVAEPENDLTFDYFPDPESPSSNKPTQPKRKDKSLKGAKHTAALKLLLLDDNSLRAVRAGLSKPPIDAGTERKLTRKERSRLTKIEKSLNLQGSDDDQLEEDGFHVNVTDKRFNKMLTSSDFAIDPTDPAFKRTKGADNVMKEVSKLKREAQAFSRQFKPRKETETPSSTELFDLDSMVKKLKQIPSKLRKKNGFSKSHRTQEANR